MIVHEIQERPDHGNMEAHVEALKKTMQEMKNDLNNNNACVNQQLGDLNHKFDMLMDLIGKEVNRH